MMTSSSASSAGGWVHHSIYYRSKARFDRWGLEALCIRERRRPRMPSALGPHLEQRILAFLLAHPGFVLRASPPIGARIGRPADLPHGIWHCLRRHGLNTRAPAARGAGYGARYERRPHAPQPERYIEAQKSGELAGLDCF